VLATLLSRLHHASLGSNIQPTDSSGCTCTSCHQSHHLTSIELVGHLYPVFFSVITLVCEVFP
jgi:hypothetical protein